MCQVNLFLRVVRRREDGYHDLASLFHVSDGTNKDLMMHIDRFGLCKTNK